MAIDGVALMARLEFALSDAAQRALRRTVDLAEQASWELFLVGGAVRDLLLGRSNLDLDLVVQGDAIEIGSALAASTPRGRLVRHTRFGTASVVGEGFRFDLAQARSERYARPGALPQVEPALLQADLARRDFTINAMALCLTGPRAGRLIDPYEGRHDLAARRVRVLHDESFRDDATRILRAVRYAGRLGFTIDQRTKLLLTRDISYTSTISPARIRHEFERIAEEEETAAVLRIAEKLGVLGAVHPALQAGKSVVRASEGVVLSSNPAALLFGLLLSNATSVEATAAAERLALRRDQAAAVRGLIALRRVVPRLGGASLRVSTAVRQLDGFSPVSIEAFARLNPHTLAGHRARRYLDEWRTIRPYLNGRDVVALGVQPGPPVGRVLEALLRARLDGRAKTREGERALLKRMLQRSRKTVHA